MSSRFHGTSSYPIPSVNISRVDDCIGHVDEGCTKLCPPQPRADRGLKVFTSEFSSTTGIASESPVQKHIHALPSIIN